MSHGNIDALNEKLREVFDQPELVIDTSYKSLWPDEKPPMDTNKIMQQAILKIPAFQPEVVRETSRFPCFSGAKHNTIPWLECRIRGMGSFLLFLALLNTVFVAMELCCGAYYSKTVTIIGYSAIILTVGAAAQTIWHVGFLEYRGTSPVKICLSKMLQFTAMGVNFCLVILAVFYSASEPECRKVDSEGKVISVTATTPSGGPMCYADMYSSCFAILIAIIVLGVLEFIVGLMLTEKIFRVDDEWKKKGPGPWEH
ncbi:uncharacterized protein LOC135489849 isoform X2 [Lineus longissimus]